MNPYNSTTGITANGIYTIEAKFVGGDYILYVSGTFGGGTITYGYVDASDNFATIKKPDGEDLTATNSSGYIIVAPPSRQLAVNLTGSTSPNIKLAIAHRQG